MAAPTAYMFLSDRNAFEQLLGQLMANSNEQRSQAESVFNDCKKNPEPLVGQLMATLQQSKDDTIRSLCAVLLRKVLTKDNPSLWTQLPPAAQVRRLNIHRQVEGVVLCNTPPSTQVAVKAELLKCMTAETRRSILRKVCDTVSELAAGTEEQWLELSPFLMQCVQSGNPLLTESALLIYAELVNYGIEFILKDAGALHGLLTPCMSSDALDVRLAAVKLAVALIDAMPNNAQREPFQPLIPAMLATVAHALNTNEEEAAQEAVEQLIELAEAHPRFLRRQLGDVLNAMLVVAEAATLDSATRQLAAEFAVTLCEARDKAPGMMRKLPAYVGRLFSCLVSFLFDVEDVEEWHRGDSEAHENEGEGELYDVGQECLDRIALALGGNTIAPIAQSLFPQLMGDADWRKRHAALICLAQIAEGCVKVMSKNMNSLVQMCLLGLQDSSVKVRWAACQAIGQMCTDLGPDIQQQHHTTLLPALMQAMTDFNAPRVQAHASAAIVNFSEACNQTILAPYLDTLIGTLVQLLQRGQRIVQEGALTALASVADASQQHFISYFDAVMPLLTNILMHATDKSNRLLRAKALECISLVGMAVGRDRFRTHAHDVMQFINAMQSQAQEDDDPTSSYLLQAGARICKCLGDEFLPYLATVMPPLLASAQLKPDVQIQDADSEADEEEEDDEVETIYLGDRKISIRTSSLEEKATACNMLCCYVDELKGGFCPYVKEVANIMVPLLRFYFHEDVRIAAVNSLPELLTSAVMAAAQPNPPVNINFAQELLVFVWQPLLEAMTKEPETEVLSSMLESADSIISTVSPHSLLTLEQLGGLFTVLEEVLRTSEERRKERMQRREQEDFDAEEDEALVEELRMEDDLLDQLGTVLGTVLRCYGDNALPLVERLLAPIGALLDKGRTAEERRIAVCIMDDIVEHSPAGADKYMGTILPVLLDAAKDSDPTLRQCAAYGLGVVGQHRGQHLKPRVPEVVQICAAIMSDPEARSNTDNATATDNAVAALGKVLEFHGECVDGGAVGGLWVNALPLQNDVAEAKYAHAQLVRMLEASDARVLGENNKHLHKIVQVMVEVLSKGNELIEPAAAHRMVTLLKQMQQALPADVFQSFFAQLEPAAQANLQGVLQG